ncbi:MAG TPA: PilZ domain-containing protein [Nitrospirae bacterium]|nr:PilZ domain protein [bacterium BMS3Abin06]HDH13696.1 PilZ domain-containing protein [Nitrospirota bacterium]HDZ00765.1 PilZ domain-containing protein [Nitrospirota bacterium]
MSVTAELTYNMPGEDKTHKGQCRNLSHSGIQFETDKPLQEGTSLEITIDTKSEKFRPMNAIVEVLRTESSGDNEYKIAGRILEYK